MATGDLIEQPWQIQPRDLLLGPGTDYTVAGLDGFRSRRLRNHDEPQPDGPGSIPGVDFHDADTKVLTVSMGRGNGVTTPDEVMDLEAALSAAWKPGATIELPYWLPGEVGIRFRYGRTRDYEPDLADVATGHVVARCAFEDVDGREFQGGPLQSVGLPTTSGGLTFDATPDFVFGSTGADGAFLGFNLGDTGSPWFATIGGPVTNPRITQVTTGAFVGLDVTLAAGDVVAIDSRTKTVLFNGASRQNLLTPGYEWFEVQPGGLLLSDAGDEIQFTGDDGDGTERLRFNNWSAWN